MAYERTWVFGNLFDVYSGSTILDTARRRLFNIKQFLTGTVGGSTSGAWTVRYSCDGVTAGTAGDGVDRWGTTYTPANIVRGGSGAARSWMVLRSPTLATGTANNGVPMTIDLLISFGDSTTDYSAVFTYSKAGFSGGTTTSNPTAPTPFWGGFGGTSITPQAVVPSGAAANLRLHGIRSSTGDFFLFGNAVGSTTGADFVMLFAAPVGCNTTDVYPIYNYGGYSAGSEVLNTTNLSLAGSTSVGIPAWNGTNLASVGLAIPIISTYGPDASNANRLVDLPSWVIGRTNTQMQTRGRLPDVGVMPASLGAGTFTIPTGSTIRDALNNIEYCTVGPLIIPFNAAPDMA